MLSRWCRDGSIAADTRGSSRSVSRGRDRYAFIGQVTEAGTGVLTLRGPISGTREPDTSGGTLRRAVNQAREEGPGAGVPTLNDGTIIGVRDNIGTGILAVKPHPETGDSRRSGGISGGIPGHSSRGIVSEGRFGERRAIHSIRGRNAIQRQPTANSRYIWGHSLPKLQEEPVRHDRSHHPHGVSLWSPPVPYQQCLRRQFRWSSTWAPEPQLVQAEQETSPLWTSVVSTQQWTVEPETSKSDGKRNCPLCHKAVDHLRRHVEQHHVPWYFCPERVCWQCRSSSNSLKQLWRMHGNCQDGVFNNHWLEVWVATMWGWLDLASQYAHCSGVKGLLELFFERKWYAQEAGFCPSATRELLLNQIQNVYGDAGLEVCLWPPNCPSAVLTWFGCLQMLQELQEEDRDSLLLY